MIKPLNHHHLVRLIDNTQVNPFYSAHVPGYTNLSRVIHANLGEVLESESLKKGSLINFYTAGISRIDKSDRYFIPDNQIFFYDGQIRHKGVVVKARPIKQSNLLTIRTQDFFVVRQSNCAVSVRNLVVCVPSTAFRFNLPDEENLFFLDEHNIVLVVDPAKGILPGPDFQMLRIQKKAHEFLSYEEEIPGCGALQDQVFYFTRKFFRIKISGVDYCVVRKRDIYGKT